MAPARPSCAWVGVGMWQGMFRVQGLGGMEYVIESLGRREQHWLVYVCGVSRGGAGVHSFWSPHICRA